MALVKSRGLVLKVHPLGETSKVVVCYTRDHGKVRLLAKGGRKGGSRLGASLEPFVVSGVVFYMRQGRELSLVSQADIESGFPGLRRDVRDRPAHSARRSRVPGFHREAEVRDVWKPSGIHEHILRLQVTVQGAALVGKMDRLGDEF